MDIVTYVFLILLWNHNIILFVNLSKSGLKMSSMENLNKIFKKFKNKYNIVGVMNYKNQREERDGMNTKEIPEVITRPSYSTDLWTVYTFFK